MIDLSVIEAELRGGHPQRDIRLKISRNTDEVHVLDGLNVAARIHGAAILVTPKRKLVEMFKEELAWADQLREKAGAA